MSETTKQVIREYTNAVKEGNDNSIRETGKAVDEDAKSYLNPDERRR